LSRPPLPFKPSTEKPFDVSDTFRVFVAVVRVKPRHVIALLLPPYLMQRPGHARPCLGQPPMCLSLSLLTNQRFPCSSMSA